MENVDRTCQMRYCVHCGDEACYPHGWEEDGPDHWTVTLRCGNCDTYREGRFHQDEVEDFDCWLDDCADEIQQAYIGLVKDNMKGELERWSIMLEKDVIMPDDFYGWEGL